MAVKTLWEIVERMQGRIAGQVRILLEQPPLEQSQFDTPESRQRRIEALRDAGRNAPQPDDSRHEEWMQQHIAAGWRYGETFNAAEKRHPNLLPWDQLKPKEQAKIRIFRIVAEAAAELDATLRQPEEGPAGAVSGCGGHAVGPTGSKDPAHWNTLPPAPVSQAGNNTGTSSCGDSKVGPTGSAGSIGPGPAGPVGDRITMTPRQIASERLDAEFVQYVRQYGAMPRSYLATESMYRELEDCGLLEYQKQACEGSDNREHPPTIFGGIPVHRYCVERHTKPLGGYSYVVSPPYQAGFQPWLSGSWTLDRCPIAHLYHANVVGDFAKQ